MKSDLDCIQCFIKQAINVGRLATSDSNIQETIVKKTIEALSDFDLNRVPVAVSRPIHAMIKELSGNADPYKKIKEESNEKALKLIPFIDQLIGESWEKALHLLAISNIIDFGPFSPTNDLKGFIEKKLESPLPEKYPTKALLSDIGGCSKLLFVADNCGEIIFDLFFIEKFLSDKKVYLAVRERPILNDVSMNDLETLKIPTNVTVVSTGSDAPGALLEICSSQFQDLYKRMPLVISKGQGNYESLSETPRQNLYYLLIAKCSVIAQSLGHPVGTPIINCAPSQ